MWKLTNKAKGQEPLPGVPWRDMEDAEFREVAKAYAALGFPSRALHGSGFFEHDKADADADEAEADEEEGD